MSQSHTILLVEDDEKLGAQVVGHLEAAGYGVHWLRDGRSALEAQPDAYSLWILDLMLPKTYGLDILKQVRETSDVPVLVLSAKSQTHVKVHALSLGADDYMTKPFWPEELLARVQARLRRPQAARETEVTMGSLRIELEARRVQVEGAWIELTRVEFDLLAALARRPGAAIQRERLADEVLEPGREGATRSLDAHVSRLRKKLGSAGGHVATVWGVGYRLEEHPG